MIAAFAEYENADYVISEDKHIYKNLDIRVFNPVNAEEFLKALEEG